MHCPPKVRGGTKFFMKMPPSLGVALYSKSSKLGVLLVVPPPPRWGAQQPKIDVLVDFLVGKSKKSPKIQNAPLIVGGALNFLGGGIEFAATKFQNLGGTKKKSTISKNLG